MQLVPGPAERQDRRNRVHTVRTDDEIEKPTVGARLDGEAFTEQRNPFQSSTYGGFRVGDLG